MVPFRPSALLVALLAPAVVAQDTVERVATGFTFLEGPAWDPVGRTLRFSDVPASRVHELGADGTVTTWLEPTGRANGLTFDAEGRLFACLGGARQVVRFDPDGTRAVLADAFDGKRLNSPNDLALDPSGGVWFTDPRYGDASDCEQDRMAVYHVDPADGAVRRAVDDVQRPNGILVSRDGFGLYVADPERRALRYYPIVGRGHVGPGLDVFVGDPELDGYGPDGMALDRDGRIFATYAGIVVLAADGTLVRRIPIPERPANCTFGGDDLRTLYVTARTSLYRVHVDVPGAPPPARPTGAPGDAPVPHLRSTVVDGHIGIGYGVATADVDGDGHVDIVLVDQDDVAWYRNPGARDAAWPRHVIAHELSGRLHHVCIAARDLDGDGRAELAAGAAWNPSDTVGSGSVHWLEAPADRTQPWRVVDLPHEPTVHRMRFVRARQGFELVVVPLHGRGNVDTEGAGARILAYRRGDDGGWSTSVVDQDLHATHNVDPVQWDDDAEEELLVAAKEGVFLLDRADDGAAWRRTSLVRSEDDPVYRGASEVRAGRLPDGRRFVATIEPFHGDQLVVYVPPEAGGPRRSWNRVFVRDGLAEGHAIAIGDLLGAGADQVVFGWRRPDADGRLGIATLQPFDASFRTAVEQVQVADLACEDLRLCDLDGDGDLDVVACGRTTHDLRIAWNDPE